MEARRIVVLLSIVGVLVLVGPALGQTEEELLAIHEAQLAALNAHDLDTMMSYWAEDSTYFLVHSPPPAPKAYVRAAFAQRFAARPDFRMTMTRVLAGDSVVVEEGTTLYTDMATGAEVVIPHISIYDFEGDKIKKVTSYNDRLGSMVTRGEADAPEIPDLVPSVTMPDPEPTGLSPMEANAEHVRRWNSNDATLMAKIYAADCTIFAGPLGMEVDRVAMTAMNEMFFSAFPGIELDVVRTLDLGDAWVLTEMVAHAVHTGSFMGIPASGYPTELRAAWLTHYTADGLLDEGSFYYDNLTLINQMTTAPEYSPAGTWVVTVPTQVGNITMIHTVSPQCRTGSSFAGVLKQVNENPTNFGMFPEADSGTHWVTQTVWTGRDTVASTNLCYLTKQGEGPLAETVAILIASVEWTLTGPNTNEGSALMSVYTADQDADGDGFPDEGQEPVECMPFAFTSKRLTVMPPCIPTAIPQETAP